MRTSRLPAIVIVLLYFDWGEYKNNMAVQIALLTTFKIVPLGTFLPLTYLKNLKFKTYFPYQKRFACISLNNENLVEMSEQISS